MRERPLHPSLQHLRVAGPPGPPGARVGVPKAPEKNLGYVNTIPDGGRQIFAGTVTVNGQNPTMIRGISNTRRRIILRVLDEDQRIFIGNPHVGTTGSNAGFPVFGPTAVEPIPEVFIVNSKDAIWAIAPTITDNVRVAFFDEFDQFSGE